MNTSPSHSVKAVLVAATLALGGAGAAPAGLPTPSEQAEIVALQAARVSPVDAIRAAETHIGGKALGFGYERDANTDAYEVTVASASGLKIVQIDPVRGSVLKSKDQPPDAMAADGLPAAELRKAEAAPTSLVSAVIAAEHASGGRALEANYVVNRGHMRINVDIAHAGKIVGYNVDPATGRTSRLPAGESQSRAGASNGVGAAAWDVD